MSLKNRFLLSFNVQAQIPSTSLTPFLYQTRTLEGPPSAKFISPILRTREGPRGFCTTSRSFAQPEDTHRHYAIPFENTAGTVPKETSQYRFRPAGSRGQETKSTFSPNSTLTASEKAVFDRIFSDISRLAGYSPKQAEVPDELDEGGDDADKDIYTIFETAIEELKKQEQLRAASFDRHRTRVATIPKLRAVDLSLDLGDVPRFTGEHVDFALPLSTFKEGDEFRIERRLHEEKFTRDLGRAKTDAAVWSLLEAQVFSLIASLQKRNEEATERSSKPGPKLVAPKTPKRGKGKASKPSNETDTQAVASESSNETGKSPAVLQDLKPRRDCSTPESAGPVSTLPVFGTKLSSPPNPPTFPPNPPSSLPNPPSALPNPPPSHPKPYSHRPLRTVAPPPTTALPPDVALSIVQHNYGNYCLHALQTLRREFPASPYTMQILPTIKRLGAISYVLGATSSLYNELLFLRWTQYTDIHSMADLLEEMRNQGVEQNEVTEAVLRAVRRERRALFDNLLYDGVDESGDKKLLRPDQRRRQRVEVQPGDMSISAWWKLRGVQKSWSRLSLVFRKARERMEERRLRAERDERDLCGVDEEEDEAKSEVEPDGGHRRVSGLSGADAKTEMKITP